MEKNRTLNHSASTQSITQLFITGSWCPSNWSFRCGKSATNRKTCSLSFTLWSMDSMFTSLSSYIRPMTHGQCDAKSTVSFPATEHHRLSVSAISWYLVTKAHVLGQAAHSCYTTAWRHAKQVLSLVAFVRVSVCAKQNCWSEIDITVASVCYGAPYKWLGFGDAWLWPSTMTESCP